MYEVNEAFDFNNATYNELFAETARLTMALKEKSDALTSLENKMMYVEKAFDNRERQYQNAKGIITSLIELEEIDNEEAVKELVYIFGIEIMKQVQFTLTLEISGTTEIPLGSELDEYSFNVDSMSYNGQDVDFSQDNVEIQDWNFEE